ncbi:MAG TPA: twin-arginine translocase TatA/TatE family subunit [Actinomycetota bacterium]|nr:twin-arginine translocase TatA/TatE family subunit [Actinomycetota bacterium]
MGRIGPTELLIVLVIILVLFGAGRLPKLARSMREARDEFEKGRDEDRAATNGEKP